ncbi:DUF4167 domain-containing protein [Nisaea acidiphila]|uniref:DUF4167 domain-containing protein n=1 Tax=Nisaea acidiphila TaxID=1862145 RepID=A0A9J7AUL9_9PROT|nr:DUF4167 domain-containing protein [Nisaea acidiphila]UUX51427.1 DUF4167 domain-containing protein [Nisaea acidiphila]
MRQGPHSKRGRGRGGNRRPNVPNRNQTFDSNGPDVRIRGNAHQVYEKYLTLARDATTSGDRVLAESLYQHADHYFRIYSAFNEENEARRNAQQQDNAPQQDPQQTRSDEDGESESSNDQVPAPSDDDQAAARKTRSERRQDAEAAEQADQERTPRQPRRRRNSNGTGSEPQAANSDNDSALRAMLGASESGMPKDESGEAEASEEPKPVRRRGRPRKVAEPAEQSLPLAGED